MLAFTLVAFIDPPGQLTGRWQKRLPNGVVVGAVFRLTAQETGSNRLANGTFDTKPIGDDSLAKT